jgi:hypothetical protein
LLKSLYPYSPPNSSSSSNSMNDSLLNPAKSPSIFEAVISNPYAGFTLQHSLNNAMEASSETVASSLASLGPLGRGGPAAKRSAGERTSLASYIRLFEPMVIKALKHYTVSCQVRYLLPQSIVVFLKVPWSQAALRIRDDYTGF